MKQARFDVAPAGGRNWQDGDRDFRPLRLPRPRRLGIEGNRHAPKYFFNTSKLNKILEIEFTNC